MKDRIGYGLIGAGSFGQFCLEQYREMEGVRVVAIADANPDAATQAAKMQGVEACPSVDALLERDDIGIVHLATPPFTHRDLTMKALDRGKHVLCEKPLATNIGDAEAMIRKANDRGLVLAVNLIMRYNPLCAAVKRVIDSGLLGEPLHGFFENYAKDQPLQPNHWFWNREKSGGIFVEHGVHFFDLFRWWLGDGRVVAAQQTMRPNGGMQEQVQATLRHDSGALVNHYHGFTQPSVMDRQEMRILCERGTLRLFEWVPTRCEIECLIERSAAEQIAGMLPDGKVEQRQALSGDETRVSGRHKPWRADGRFRVTGGTGMEKPALYGHVVRELLADQIAAAGDPKHDRRITEENGLRSLETAVEAQRLADAAGGTGSPR